MLSLLEKRHINLLLGPKYIDGEDSSCRQLDGGELHSSGKAKDLAKNE